MKKQAFIISVEGIDGSGKTTLVESLYKALKYRYMDPESKLICEKKIATVMALGSGSVGREIKAFLASVGPSPFEKHEAQYVSHDVFFGAAIAQYHRYTLPTLAETYDILITDRSVASFYAYQVHDNSSQVADAIFNTVIMPSHGTVMTDLHVHIQCDAEITEARLSQRDSVSFYFDEANEKEKKRIRRGYDIFNNTYLRAFSKNVMFVTCTQTTDDIVKKIIEKMEELSQ